MGNMLGPANQMLAIHTGRKSVFVLQKEDKLKCWKIPKILTNTCDVSHTYKAFLCFFFSYSRKTVLQMHKFLITDTEQFHGQTIFFPKKYKIFLQANNFFLRDTKHFYRHTNH